ncbi:MAG: hypothetical protein RIS92_585 [Verrucomicrobiota bacterium]|jgi:hypothetical protein
MSNLSKPSAPEIPALSKERTLDLYFMDARCKLIEVAAFLDRLDRSSGSSDFRESSLLAALDVLSDGQPDRARRVLMTLSDPTTEPLPSAGTKGACGAWPHFKSAR